MDIKFIICIQLLPFLLYNSEFIWEQLYALAVWMLICFEVNFHKFDNWLIPSLSCILNTVYIAHINLITYLLNIIQFVSL